MATISHAQVRYKWGNLTSSIPSRFIAEIDPEWIDNQEDEISTATTGTLGGMQTNPANFGKSNLARASQGRFQGRRLARIEADNAIESDEPSKGLNTNSIKEGTVVYHERFGKGTVIAIENDGQNAKAIVNFITAGQKNLLLKFAKLKIIG